MHPDPGGAPYWSPNTSVFVSESGDLIIKVDLNEMRSADLEITVDGKKLKVAGVRRDPEMSNARQRLIDEIPTGQFEAVVEAPDEFDLSKAQASYRNGTLRIVVPRSPPAPPTILDSPRRF